MNKIKLISTLGPACDNKEVLNELVKNGLSVARFNFSHANYDNSKRILKIIQEINKENNSYLATMLDTKGPEIRTHEFDGTVQIEKDSEVRIAFNEVLGTKDKFSLTYDKLYDDIVEGNFIFIDDGYLTLEVIKKDEQKRELVTKAKNTHIVKSRRGVNIPNVKLQMPYISEKDKNDIIFACQQKYDFLALSFVRKKEDVLDVRKILESQQDHNIKIISKIENQEGLDNLDEIIQVSDGIMVARGDLGIEIDSELVPFYQSKMIKNCLREGKLVVVATQMLESMQKNPRPTKAETSDVYNSVLEGASATMLSGETASGLYPEKAVLTMAKIQKEAEKNINYDLISLVYDSQKDEDILTWGIIQMTLKYSIAAIIVDDKKYAIALSKFRSKVPVFVKVKNNTEATSLALNFSNVPFVNDQELQQKLTSLQKNNDSKLLLQVVKDTLKVISF
ncbi:pyruvate kinase [Columbia Basin potato purple top phytoplasma]|uniref:Pyruvate kinase n=1 Tax=Columbia Basin potato purple top phytoplasma TaxID=307134 RepID=A0ABT5L856_9MOLU|nr:pyruvate kinase [Columbia Basin potato purple top phytoplasma]MDC9031858.1 pyruvate kinase [Columbia Basin potato purple top phytoplasma]